MELPAGKYFIGDPCYAIPQEDWDEYLNQYLFVKGEGGEGTLGTYKNRDVWADGTAYGDGVFFGSDGNKYGVDSGTIGATPIEFVEKEDLGRLKQLGSIKLFTKPFDVFTKKGVFFIADLIIDTN